MKQLLRMICYCGQQNLVNLIGCTLNKCQEFVLGREKKRQENKLLSCLSVLLVSTETVIQEEKLDLVLSFF